MATPSHAQAVKSLNTSGGRRRFVFKIFSQRVGDIDINANVFRSLDELKREPTKGSSFLLDHLIEWRELNTAEDFISFYEEMMPLVQTLPLVLLHKELILLKLISRLQMKARLSLEPILRLLAAFSRDLLKDFLPFLPRVVDSLVSLLESGADRDPEIIEQIFTSWSYIIMYLQSYLSSDIIYILKSTVRLRYYPKDYIQEFMAKSISFLLRTAPDEQLVKGIRRTLFEVVKKPLSLRNSAVSNLFCDTILGTQQKLHSKADRVLSVLVDSSIYDRFPEGSDSIIEVVTLAFENFCQELDLKGLENISICLSQEIENSMESKLPVHLSRLLSLLIAAVSSGRAVSDCRWMLAIAESLVPKICKHSREYEKHSSKIVEKVMQLMLCILDGLHNSDNVLATSTKNGKDKKSAISECLLDPLFEFGNQSLVAFLRELLLKDSCIVDKFRVPILRAMNDMKEFSEIEVISKEEVIDGEGTKKEKKRKEDVISLLLSICERWQINPQNSDFMKGMPEGGVPNICQFMQEATKKWIEFVQNPADAQVDDLKLAELWGIIRCCPHVLHIRESSPLLLKLVNVLNQLLEVEDENIAGVPRSTWQSLVAAALSSYNKWHYGERSDVDETREVLLLAKSFRSSSQVLSAVSDYLDSRSALQVDVNNVVDVMGIFATNLCQSDKGLRLSTLKILCHYETLSGKSSLKNQLAEKKMKRTVSQACITNSEEESVLRLLLLIESTPLSISTSRSITLSISKIQMGLAAGRIPEIHMPLVLNGMLGIFYNRFSSIWDPACECLALLINKHAGLVWDRFIAYFEACQSLVLTPSAEVDGTDEIDKADKVDGTGEVDGDEEVDRAEKVDRAGGDDGTDGVDGADFGLSDHTTDLTPDLNKRFESYVNPTSDNTPGTTILSLLLQSLQKVPFVAESHSRQIIPLFLRFLGYHPDNLASVGVFDHHTCKGKESKGVLKEWLNLLKLMRNVKSFYKSQFLKEVLQNRLLDENDADIQMKVLDCLLLWKDDFLLPYDKHLTNLIISKKLREEMTTWSLSRDSGLIEDGHRSNLVPLVLRLLVPKVRKLKTLAARKNASVHHRKAVLGFIAQVDVDELPLFFSLLIKPLLIIPYGADQGTSLFWSHPQVSINEFQALNFLKYFTVENITALSWKKRYGFLHVVEDILNVFDEMRIRPYLDLLMGCAVRILVSCSSNLDIPRGGEFHQLASSDFKQFKDLRSLCLKLVSLCLNKYENHDLGCEFWDLFFKSVKPLIDGFKKEGSSSEKPSSLFSCFLAMSRNHKLVSLLSREKNLIPDIFSILTLTTASEAIVSCVLKFIENLLILDYDLDGNDDDVATQSVLHPHLESLVDSLHALFYKNNTSKRKMVRYPGEIEIRIFKMLLKHIKDPSLEKKFDPSPAEQFVDILLPLLSKRPKGSDVSLEAIQILRDIMPVLGSISSKQILDAVSPQLVSAEMDMRSCICELLEALAKSDDSLLIVARLVSRLNKTSAVEMDGLDYDCIVNAYGEIGVGFFYTIPEEHALLILSHCVYDMSSEELILRHSAYRSLLSFVEFCAQVLQRNDTCNCESADGVMEVDEGYWTEARLQRMINKSLLKHMGDAMSHGRSIKKEWIDLLREMVIKLPEVSNLSLLKALCSEDAEVDFFNNIIHLQKHRRAKALLRFRNAINKSCMSEVIINKVFIPLFFNMLFDFQHRKDEHIKTACVEALSSISAHMEWKPYYALLMRCFREMKLNADKEKVLLRLICAILGQFHFSQTSAGGEANISLQSNLDGEMFNSGSLILQKCSNSMKVDEIQTCLYKSVLPKIQKLSSDSDKVNVNVNFVALKVLKLLPEGIMEVQLPTIIHRISNFLKSRLESTRDEARQALADCVKELGLEYLKFIVQVLRATLKRGFELHVLGYTLNFLLSKTLTDASSGKLDYCLEDLLCVVENDILGDVAEEKDVEKIASKMKETRKCRSFETLKMIAQCITFKTHALKLLNPIMAHLQKHLTPKLKKKLESMLNHIAAGIECNPSVVQTDLLIFVYGLIRDGINEENEPKTNTSEASSGSKSVGSHLLTAFALGVLQNRMKNMKLDKNDEQLLSMLDPFVKLLGSCLSSRYEDILSASLRCLAPLVRLPLQSLESQADKLKVILLDIAQGSVNPSSLLMESCLKVLTAILRNTKITLSSEQLQLLIQFPMFVDLERNPSFVALSLLKAIISRKLVVHEIYDVVLRVAELMITSQVEPIRKKCSQILLQFLLDYHLSDKRSREHLNFLLANLRYEHATGREAVLEMLHAIIIKSRKSVVDELSETILFPLVVCLANDQDNKVRSMTAEAIRLLIGRISQKYQNSILEYSLSWYQDQQLSSSGAQVLGLLVEVMKKGFQSHTNAVLPVAKSILQKALNVLNDGKDDLSIANAPFWKEAYYSLILLEKLLCQLPGLSLAKDLEEIWEMVCDLLLHPHSWLRNVSNRLVSVYLSSVIEDVRKNPQKSFEAFSLTRPNSLFTIAVSLCCQLKAQIIDNASSNLITENLVSTVCGMHSSMVKWASLHPAKFWSGLEKDEQGRFLKAFHLLDSRQEKDLFLYITSSAQNQSDSDQFEDARCLLVSSLLKTMGKLALQMEAVQMRIVFTSFQKISLQLGPDDCQQYALQMLIPLYKVCEGSAGKVIDDDLMQFSQEVRDSVRNVLGIQNFVQIYSEISKTVKTKRDKRKREEKVMAVVNPVRNAKRKQRISAKHSANKKRKMMTMKMQRWMH